jgi:DNA-binding PadR family transcriptional regulator
VPEQLNPTAAALLGMLHDGAQSGWDLARRAESTIGDFWRITQSQVYRELVALADRRLVSTGHPGPRDRRTYRITAAGRRAFAAWIDEPPGPEQIRMPLLLTMHFGKHLRPGRLTEFLGIHRSAHQARLAYYESIAQAADGTDADPYVMATLQFGIAYERAVLGWFDTLDLGVRGVRRERRAARSGSCSRGSPPGRQ